MWCEVPALVEAGVVHDVVGPLGVLAWRHGDVVRECGDSGRQVAHRGPWHRMRHVVVVGPDRRADRVGEPVERGLHQDLVIGPASGEVSAAVTPGAVLLQDPGQQTGRRVAQAVGQCQGAGLLLMLVSAAVAGPGLDARQVGLLSCREIAVVDCRHHRHQVDACDCFRVGCPEARGDPGTEVAPVRQVAVVAEPRHEAVPEFVGRNRRRSLGGLIGEGEPRQRRYDDVVSEVGQPVRQWDHLGEGARPPVGEDHRKACRLSCAHVEEVNPLSADGRDSLRLGIQASLVTAPVESMGPVVDQVCEDIVVGSRQPGRLGPRSGPARRREAMA